MQEEIPNRYKALLNYLANGRWKEADKETGNVMVEVAGRKERGYLNSDDIDKFPCEDLRIINQLWLKFSGGHFGFSVQKEIYESLGGTREYNREVWENFGDRVGWRKGDDWLNYSDLTFNVELAPKAHLPRGRAGEGCRSMYGGGGFGLGCGVVGGGGFWGWSSLAMRKDL